MRGRKSITEKYPALKDDIKEIVDRASQIDPKFQSERLYSNLSVSSIRKDLVREKGYSEETLPTNQTINNIVTKMGYTLRKVQKTKPIDRVNETDAIFENLKKAHEEIATDENILRISIDSKDRVKIGEFSRRGKNRVDIKAKDHDFGNEYVTPFGILDVKTGDIELSISKTKVTADFMADRIEEYISKEEHADKKTIFINSDNGPENSSHRTQYIKRMVELASEKNVTIILGYYPPYHSKYNPIERVWGALENYWNGNLLDSVETVVEFAKRMTYNSIHPNVKLIDKVYETGIKLPKKVMNLYELALERMTGIERWFVKIDPAKCTEILCENNLLN